MTKKQKGESLEPKAELIEGVKKPEDEASPSDTLNEAYRTLQAAKDRELAERDKQLYSAQLELVEKNGVIASAKQEQERLSLELEVLKQPIVEPPYTKEYIAKANVLWERATSEGFSNARLRKISHYLGAGNWDAAAEVFKSRQMTAERLDTLAEGKARQLMKDKGLLVTDEGAEQPSGRDRNPDEIRKGLIDGTVSPGEYLDRTGR